MNTEDGLVRVWGYTTHLQLKQQGNYNQRNRTYSLDAQQLTRDINLLWVTRQFCPDAPTQSEIQPLPVLSREQANELLKKLTQKYLFFPGRTVPFSLWGALLEQDEYRQCLLEWQQFSQFEVTPSLG